MRLYVREIHHLGRTVDAFELDWLRASPQLLSDTTITFELPEDLICRIDGAELRGRTYSDGRTHSPRWFIRLDLIELPSDVADDDPANYRALQIVPLALLLTLNPNLRFGPLLGAHSPERNWLFFTQRYDELHSIHGPFRKLPTHFFDYDYPPSFEHVRFVSEALLREWETQRLKLACDRYVRACLASRRDSAIVELSIAFEILLLRGDGGKRKALARRAAVLLGTVASEREHIYQEVGALYGLRNAVVHQGQFTWEVVLSDGSQLHPLTLIRSGRRYVANIIREFLRDSETCLRCRKEFLDSLDQRAGTLKPELDEYERRFFSGKPANQGLKRTPDGAA